MRLRHRLSPSTDIGGTGFPLSASLGGARVVALCKLEHIILCPWLCRAEGVTGEGFPGHTASHGRARLVP